MKFFRPVLFSISLFFAAQNIFAQDGTIDFWTDLPDEKLAAELTERMSDEELLAQILMFGWAGAEPSDLLNSWVTQRGLGSVKVFGWNTDNIQKVAKSVRQLQQEAAERPFKIPLLLQQTRKADGSGTLKEKLLIHLATWP